MTPGRFEAWLAEAIEAQRADEDEDPICRVETYADAEILTRDNGLVVRFEDGSEIQITLVLSRRGRDDDDE